ncbi:hypothetical protein ACLK1T_23865 [Escherichia coli]
MEKGYEVHGIQCCALSFNTERVDYIYQDRTPATRIPSALWRLSDTSNLMRIFA